MTISHKPENTTKTNEAHPSLGKLATAKPWVVVEDAGTDRENILDEYPTWKAAFEDNEAFGELASGLDIMKRLPDGTLTTEF